MSTVVIQDDSLLYVLTRDQGDLVLSVVCGTIGWYELKLKLDMDEVDAFGRIGKPFIDELASLVAFDPQKYADRVLR